MGTRTSDSIPLNSHPQNPAETNWLEVVERQVQALKFGSVQITVHEGRVVQVETSIRVRFDKPQ